MRQNPGASAVVTPGAAPVSPMPTDESARRAMAWIERGQPDTEIVFDDSAPRQAPEELAQFKSATLRRKR